MKQAAIGQCIRCGQLSIVPAGRPSPIVSIAGYPGLWGDDCAFCATELAEKRRDHAQRNQYWPVADEISDAIRQALADQRFRLTAWRPPHED